MHSNLPLQEYLLAEHRAEIAREMKEIHLSQKINTIGSRLYTNSMRLLGRWLIARGKALELKYDSCPPATRRYAH